MTVQPNQSDVDAIVACATNEGELYPVWCRMARAGVNTSDGEWAHETRRYLTQLIRERRYSGAYNAATANAAAAALRDYYLRHIAEGA